MTHPEATPQDDLSSLKNELLESEEYEDLQLGLARQAASFIIALQKTQRASPVTDPELAKSQVAEVLALDTSMAIAVGTNGYEQIALSEAYASILELSPGRISVSQEHRIIQHIDPATTSYRIRAFEHFFGGFSSPVNGLISMRDDQHLYDDFACPIAFGADGKVSIFAHFIAPQNHLSLAHAWSVFDVSLLTPTQLRFLKFVLKGNSKQEVADSMNVSLRTLEKHSQAVLDHAGEPSISSLLFRLGNI